MDIDCLVQQQNALLAKANRLRVQLAEDRGRGDAELERIRDGRRQFREIASRMRETAS